MIEIFLKSWDRWKYLIISSILVTSALLLAVANKSDQKVTGKSETAEITSNNKDIESFKNFLLKQIKSPFTNLNYEIKKGDSVQKILNNFKVRNPDIQGVITQYKKYANPNKLMAGTKIEIVFEKKANKSKNSLIKFSIPVTKSTTIELSRNEDNQIIAKKIITKLYKKKTLSENIIKKNLYSSATEVNINPDTIIEFARIFGFEIDFQRDIRKNDYFKIVYEKYFDENGEFIKSGSILYAHMKVNNREIPSTKNSRLKSKTSEKIKSSNTPDKSVSLIIAYEFPLEVFLSCIFKRVAAILHFLFVLLVRKSL